MREWLKAARQKKGLTMAEIAQELDISESYFCSIENGVRQKRMDMALASRLSLILGISLPRIAEYEKEVAEQTENLGIHE